MTLIVSMRAKYGAIVLSDSQETVKDRDGNEFKYAVVKSEPEKIRGFKYVISGGGDGEGIDELSEKFKRALQKNKCRTLDDFRSLFEATLSKELRSLRRHSSDARLELIIAAVRGKKWEVWRNTRGTLVPTQVPKPTLVGFDAEVYKYVATELFPRATTTAQYVLTGLRILELARQSSTCVDAPYNGVIVMPNVISAIPSKVLGELTESVTTFGAHLDRLLLACTDTSLATKDFEKLIEEFKETAIHLRKEYLDAVARAEAISEFRDGILPFVPLTPRPSIRTVGLGTGGISVKVEEVDLQPTPSASQKSEPEQ